MTGDEPTWRRFLRHRGARWGLAMIAVLVGVATVGRAVSPDPDAPDYAAQLLSPRAGHWLGTDAAGRDLFARTAAGTWTSLSAAATVTVLTIAIGLAVGSLAGYVRGPVDAVISRLIDMMLGLPELVISLAIVGALGVGHGNLVLALTITGWAYLARVARSMVLGSHSRLDVVSARLAGVPPGRILRQHVVPPVLAQLLVLAASRFGTTVLALAGLAFLGLGAQPPASELGQMLADSTGDLGIAPWLVIGPTVVIALTVGAAMLLSDALRDTLDPAAADVPSSEAWRRRPRAAAQRRSPGDQSSAASDEVLRVRDLTVTYPDGMHAVRGVDLTILPGECVALVGESGCGKSTVARAALAILPEGAAVGGGVDIAGHRITGIRERDVRRLRGQVVGYVAQDPFAACDPLRSVGDHVAEAWRAHGKRVPADLPGRLEALGVAASRLRDRPHQWSGGMLQRATIAAAAAHEPPLMVADEPTSALDAELGDGVLDTLRTASRSLLLVTHDLALVGRHADRAAVMYAGRIVETGATAQLLHEPRHPYTQALLAATPRPGTGLPAALAGSPPVLRGTVPTGCTFADRCPRALPRCGDAEPALTDGVACWNPVPAAGAGNV